MAKQLKELTLEDLENLNPEAASVLKSMTTAAAREVEHHWSDLTGPTKKDLAQNQVEKMLMEMYKSADKAFDFPPLADLAAEALIPLIPAAIDWAVELLNKTGIFNHA